VSRGPRVLAKRITVRARILLTVLEGGDGTGSPRRGPATNGTAVVLCAVIMIYTDFPGEDLMSLLVRNSISREIKYAGKERLGLFHLI
jgi:hypothetical protein